MRDEENGARYMSPLVKQDLAKLEKDGESRRVALIALKQFVENLEPSAVPRFLAQVSESKETGSRQYAISLYEEVARVHGKLIIPQIGRVMATVIRSLSASGSSPQLHQACAKVVSALVRYSIDLETTPSEAEEILREVSRPLVDLLAGKLEPVAAGAATCMQAVVESEKWRHASADLVSEVCHRTTSALGDKSTRTVAHMLLARSLAHINPGTLSVFGACLLHAGEEVLNASANTWQQRKSAAKMVQAVVSIVDRETLTLEFTSLLQVLENCRHDRMPHVRTAVCEALQTAKMLAAGSRIRDTEDGDQSNAFDTSRVTPQRRNWSSNKYSPSSQESYHLSFTPPTSASDSGATVHDSLSTPSGLGSTGRMKRAPLFPSRGELHSPLPVVPATASGVTSNALLQGLDAKENVPSQKLGGNNAVSNEDVSGRLMDDGQLGKHERASIPAKGSHVPSSPSLHTKPDNAKEGFAGFSVNAKELSRDKDFTPTNVTLDHPKGKVESRFSPLEAMITRSFGEAEGDLMAEDEDILSGGSAELEGRLYGKDGMSKRGGIWPPNLNRHFRQDSESPESMVHSECIQSNSVSDRSVGSNISDANNAGKKGSGWINVNSLNARGVHEVENSQPQMVTLHGGAAGNSCVSDPGTGISHAQYMKLANLSNNPEDGFSALKPRVLITTADFLPYSTPRRLVLSLQSQISSPDSKSNGGDKEDSVRVGEDEVAMVAEANEDADMDVESSSEAGWSVRDNPIASDESFRTEDSSEEDVEERQQEIHEVLALPRKVASVAGVSPYKPSGSPGAHQKTRSLDSGLNLVGTPTTAKCRSNKGDDIGAYRMTPKPVLTSVESPSANLVCSSCTESQRRKSALKAQEWDLGLEINRVTEDHRAGARRSMLFEQGTQEIVGNHCCHGSEISAMDSVLEAGRGSQYSFDISNRSVSSGWWTSSVGQLSLVQSARNGCLKMTSFAEALLRGSLFVVVAIPLVMVLARALHTESDFLLVPT